MYSLFFHIAVSYYRFFLCRAMNIYTVLESCILKLKHAFLLTRCRLKSTSTVPRGRLSNTVRRIRDFYYDNFHSYEEMKLKQSPHLSLFWNWAEEKKLQLFFFFKFIVFSSKNSCGKYEASSCYGLVLGCPGAPWIKKRQKQKSLQLLKDTLN